MISCRTISKQVSDCQFIEVSSHSCHENRRVLPQSPRNTFLSFSHLSQPMGRKPQLKCLWPESRNLSSSWCLFYVPSNLALTIIWPAFWLGCNESCVCLNSMHRNRIKRFSWCWMCFQQTDRLPFMVWPAKKTVEVELTSTLLMRWKVLFYDGTLWFILSSPASTPCAGREQASLCEGWNLLS